MSTLDHRQLGELLVRAREGDERAFDQLYRATADIQWKQAYAMLHDAGLAEDAVQETYLTLYRHMGQIDSPKALVAYLNRTAYRVCLRLAQRQKQVPLDAAPPETQQLAALPDDDARHLPEEAAIEREEVCALLSALEELDPRQREAVLLHYYQRRTVAEIAQAMDCSPSTAQRLLNRARGRLRQLLGLPALLVGPAVGRAVQKLPSPTPQPPKRGRALPLPLAALLALALGGAAFALGRSGGPAITRATAASGWRAQPCPVTISVAGATPDQVVLVGPDGRSTPARRQPDGSYLALAEENGLYTALARTGTKEARREVSVRSVDRAGPRLLSTRMEGGRAVFSLADEGAGVDWSSAALTGEGGASLAPLRVDESAGEVVFSAPGGRYTLAVSDRAGNRSTGPVTLSFPEGE
ncbi:sigma-70 family RNA polymerase sigma factor [Bittarella massiliensis]|uniref:RNA polymerase sigma factor n=1 Tax=Bittarella massiliensis (ex Durand et al. 2017) TaxID=1720313 RepID=UPI00163CCD40|nr:sigma-70 family RNA polymerase sigma factor [Bittarella massiliensis (ex Durand et al. 2017)]MBC2871827.1 sigma-70 family RNA polymerase sigma factor [Bittarella massiliensis (ex Durand et al. 2017)]